MPADVPLDEQARLRFNAWRRWFWLWDVYFTIGFVSVGLLLISDEWATPTDRTVSVGALVTMAVWYLAFGRAVVSAHVDPPVWRGRVFILGVVALLVTGVLFVTSMSFALFMVCPLVFMSLPLRDGIIVVIPINMLPVLATLAGDGWEATLLQFFPGSLFTLAFAVLLGTWITKIVTQSQERAELIEELEHSREEVGRLSREAGVAAERARLAAEIHDTLAQGFTSLVTLVQAAESELDRDSEQARGHLALAARTARENLTEARALVAGLTPTALGTGSLDQAIHRQVERFAEENPVTVTYHSDEDSVALPTVLEVVLLRMVQESLTNVRKHSRATEATITLRVGDSCASMRVADNGVGFDPDRPGDGFGLRGMRNRAEQVGGRLSVHSGPDGTAVELEVPR
ncbi:sensor histidine kinase [Actinophytocola oryzae]|uniref:Signal transduction histidine kinase n=1 Tax=Actinophytocola oryzae TaxID=502181 RepID=A0A4R7V1U0_9PSEU|nr:sensor histidine kinase [Actinophytocola oryzae]TDV41805.1 signal transduction histidine kinase [Actinophytocola oryzae]